MSLARWKIMGPHEDFMGDLHFGARSAPKIHGGFSWGIWVWKNGLVKISWGIFMGDLPRAARKFWKFGNLGVFHGGFRVSENIPHEISWGIFMGDLGLKKWPCQNFMGDFHGGFRYFLGSMSWGGAIIFHLVKNTMKTKTIKAHRGWYILTIATAGLRFSVEKITPPYILWKQPSLVSSPDSSHWFIICRLRC